jgi:hypothetical protein
VAKEAVVSDPSLTEECVMCLQGTSIPKYSDINDPIRNGHYVEGSGQLCAGCFREIFPTHGESQHALSCS